MLFGSVLGLVIIVAVLAMAIRILRQPVHPYQGDLTPNERRSFRETMAVWLMGPRG